MNRPASVVNLVSLRATHLKQQKMCAARFILAKSRPKPLTFSANTGILLVRLLTISKDILAKVFGTFARIFCKGALALDRQPDS